MKNQNMRAKLLKIQHIEFNPKNKNALQYQTLQKTKKSSKKQK